MDFHQYYNLEAYLLDTVRPRFLKQGYLNAFDFFCIVIWKANRSKSKIARKLLRNHEDLDTAVQELTTKLFQQPTAKDKLAYLWLNKYWGFRLPMASAILTILYPDEFTVYDKRVCGVLDDFHNLTSIRNIDNLWDEYQRFKSKVEEVAPKDLDLRNKDRYLWGKSFHDQLQANIQQGFQSEQTED